MKKGTIIIGILYLLYTSNFIYNTYSYSESPKNDFEKKIITQWENKDFALTCESLKDDLNGLDDIYFTDKYLGDTVIGAYEGFYKKQIDDYRTGLISKVKSNYKDIDILKMNEKISQFEKDLAKKDIIWEYALFESSGSVNENDKQIEMANLLFPKTYVSTKTKENGAIQNIDVEIFYLDRKLYTIHLKANGTKGWFFGYNFDLPKNTIKKYVDDVNENSADIQLLRKLYNNGIFDFKKDAGNNFFAKYGYIFDEYRMGKLTQKQKIEIFYDLGIAKDGSDNDLRDFSHYLEDVEKVDNIIQKIDNKPINRRKFEKVLRNFVNQFGVFNNAGLISQRELFTKLVYGECKADELNFWKNIGRDVPSTTNKGIIWGTLFGIFILVGGIIFLKKSLVKKIPLLIKK